MKSLLLMLLLVGTAHADIIVAATPAPTPTPVQRKVKIIDSIMKTMIGDSPVHLKEIQNIIFNDPKMDGCQVLIGLGIDAAQVLRTGPAAVTFLNTVEPGLVPTPAPHPGYTISANMDGSANCTPPTPSPSPSPTPSPTPVP